MVKKKYYINSIPVSQNTDSYAAKPSKNIFCPAGVEQIAPRVIFNLPGKIQFVGYAGCGKRGLRKRVERALGVGFLGIRDGLQNIDIEK
jgi:hypothetical protein